MSKKVIRLTEFQLRLMVNKVIQEQLVTNDKYDDLDAIISTLNPKDVNNYKNRDLKYLMSQAGLEVDRKTGQIVDGGDHSEFDKKLKNIQSKMDSTSLSTFESIKTQNPKFYYYAIQHYYYNIESSIYKKMKIVVDSATTIKNVPTAGSQTPAPTEVIEPGYELITPENFNTSDFFVDNEATLTTAFTSFVTNNIISSINQAKENLKEKGGTQSIYLERLNIDSSCSRLRNGPSKTVRTANANGIPTFLELSTARANTAKDYIINLLTKMGAEINSKMITINPNGENGDGTSGPDFTGTDKESYNKYKYARVKLVFAIRTKKETKFAQKPSITIPPSMIPQSTTDFTIHFNAKGRNDFKINLPSFNFKLGLPNINLGGNGMKASLRQVKCSKI